MALTVFNFILAISGCAFWIGIAALLFSTELQRRLAAFLIARFKSIDKQREVFFYEYKNTRKEMGV